LAPNKQIHQCNFAINSPSGKEASKEIKKIYPDLRVLILTMHRDKENILRAMGSGADGYLVKDSAPDGLIEAILTLEEGKTYFSSLGSMSP
jgi:two-component system, NarL family, nitrate/nitrite response regulator NarL